VTRFDEFLRRAERRTGSPCRTCPHPKRAQVEADAKRLLAERKKGSRISWDYFAKHHLAAEYDYDLDGRSLVRHLEKCLGLEVH
jgi:hypothetical protein